MAALSVVDAGTGDLVGGTEVVELPRTEGKVVAKGEMLVFRWIELTKVGLVGLWTLGVVE